MSKRGPRGGKKHAPPPGAPATDARGIIVTRPMLAQLLRVSETSISEYVNKGYIARAGHGMFYLQSAVDFVIQLRQADVVVAGSLRNTKLESEVEKLRAQAELTRLEIDQHHADRLLSLTETDEKALALHARLLQALASDTIKKLAIEVGVLLSAVPAYRSWSNHDIALLACAWAVAFVDQQAVYLLGKDGVDFQNGRAWKDASLPDRAQAKPYDPRDGEPFWCEPLLDERHAGDAGSGGGWWRWVASGDRNPFAQRGKFIRLEGYAADPPKSILRALLAKGRSWKKALTEKGHSDEAA